MDLADDHDVFNAPGGHERKDVGPEPVGVEESPNHQEPDPAAPVPPCQVAWPPQTPCDRNEQDYGGKKRDA
jgi:hypothetical protein